MVHVKQLYGKSTEHYKQISKVTFEFYTLVTGIGIISIPGHHSNRTSENSSTALLSKCSFQDLTATGNSKRLIRSQGIDALPTLISRTKNSQHKIDLNIYKMEDAAANT